jgi:hypothetical protein
MAAVFIFQILDTWRSLEAIGECSSAGKQTVSAVEVRLLRTVEGEPFEQ